MKRTMVMMVAVGLMSLVGCGGSGTTGGSGGGADESKKFVGLWEMAVEEGGGSLKMDVELTSAGKISLGGAIELGTYSVKGDKMTLTMKKPDGKDDVQVATIKEVTDEKIVVIDSEKSKEKPVTITFTKKKK